MNPLYWSAVYSVMPSTFTSPITTLSPVAIRVGFVKCNYCASSQERPRDGRCVNCGALVPSVDEMYR